jgi:hypothetical protein
MIKNTKLRSEGVKRARELIYTAERQASRDVGLAGLRLKPGSSHGQAGETADIAIAELAVAELEPE